MKMIKTHIKRMWEILLALFSMAVFYVLLVALFSLERVA